MKSKVEPADLVTKRLTEDQYKKVLKDDLKNLFRKKELQVPFFFTDKFVYKDEEEAPLLIIGEGKGVSDWEKKLGIKRWLEGICRPKEGSDEIILVEASKGSDDAAVKNLGKAVDDFGYEVTALKDANAKRAERLEDMEDLQKQLAYFIGEVDKMVRYSDPETKTLIAAKSTDGEDVTELRSELQERIMKAQLWIFKYDSDLKEAIKKVNVKSKKGLLPLSPKDLRLFEAKLSKFWSKLLKIIKEYKKKIDEVDDDTDYNDILYVHGATESIIKKFDDEGHLNELATGDLDDRHPKRGDNIGKPLHQHLDGGKKGMAFTYKREENGSVTPIVYDFAANRNGNKYQWAKGGQSSGPPKVPSAAK